MQTNEQEVRSSAVAPVGTVIEGRCAICRSAVLSSNGLTDGVLLPMQGRWSVLTHRACWERFSSSRVST